MGGGKEVGESNPYLAIATLSPLPIAIVRHADDEILWINETFSERVRVGDEPIVGRRFAEFTAGGDSLRALLEAHEGPQIEMEGQRSDGTMASLLLSARVIDYHGERAIVASAANITPQKEAMAALEASEDRARAIAELAPFPIGVTRLSDAKLTYVNDAFVRFMQSTRDDLLENVAPDLYADPAARAEMLQTLERDGELLDYPIRARLPDGSERQTLTSLRFVDFDGAPSIMAAVVDVTAWQAAESALEESRAQLLHSQKTEEIGRLAGGVAHDFNNLLTAIYNSCSLLVRDLPEGSSSRSEVDEIKNAADRAASLTRQLLAISRKQETKRVVVDVNEIISGMSAILRRVIGENLSFDVELGARALPVEVDRGQLEQVILNLIVNASEAIGSSGTIRVTATNEIVKEPRPALVGQLEPGAWVTFSVSDSGPGMSPETATKVFEPFFTTKATGTGLGLSTVVGIVEQSRGALELETAPGSGTVFRVWLRKYEGAVPRTIGRASTASHTGNEHILLTEDDPRVRRLTMRLLEDLGYRVRVAPSAEAALKICDELDEPLHLLLTDVVIPGISGRELARQIAALSPSTRVLYMSGYSRDFLEHKGFLEDGINLIQKPFGPEELAEMVRAILDEAASR